MPTRNGKKCRYTNTKYSVENGKKVMVEKFAVVGCNQKSTFVMDDGLAVRGYHVEELSQDKVHIEFIENSEVDRFARLGDEGSEPLMAVMAFMVSERPDRALEVICRGNNWQKIAFALAGIFCGGAFYNKEASFAALKATGYQRLREIVTPYRQEDE